jgi:hypothetical protein
MKNDTCKKNDTLLNSVCCDVLDRMSIKWMFLDDGARCMPYINGYSDENMYRINYCPSCGKYIRSIIIKN